MDLEFQVSVPRFQVVDAMRYSPRQSTTRTIVLDAAYTITVLLLARHTRTKVQKTGA